MLLRVLVADSDPASRGQLRHHLEAIEQVIVVGEVGGPAEAVSVAKNGTNVAIVEVPEGARQAQAIDCIAQLLRLRPGISVMASGSGGSADLVIRAVRAGAVEFIRRPISREELAAAIEKVRRLQSAFPPAQDDVGGITSVYATKGGLGVTTLAANLAVCLAQQAEESTILIDLDLRQGGVTTLLDLRPIYSVLDAFGQTHRLDEAFLRGLLVRHACGLYVLPGPSEIGQVRFTPEQIREGLQLIRSHFARVVLDLPHDLDPGTIMALEESDEILYLVGLNVGALRAAAAGLAALQSLGIDRSEVKVVLARTDAREDVSPGQAQEALGVPIFWRIPNDYRTVVSSINRGTPLVLSSPRTEVARNLQKLGETLVREPAPRDDGKDRSFSLLRHIWTSG